MTPTAAVRGAVLVPFRGRLGNRLAQYCVGRILASELDFDLYADSIAGFPGVQPIGTTSLGDLAPASILQLSGHRVDLAAVLRDRARFQYVLLRGHFLRYENFRPYKRSIREAWLASASIRRRADDDELTVHIRSGDIWQSNVGGAVHPEYHALPFSYYDAIVASQRWRRITVVTDDPQDPMVRKLARERDAEVHSGDHVTDFAHLRASANLVLSVGSFSWWAGWLSDAARIYFPLAGLFDPARASQRQFHMQPNLWVDDEPRYHAIRVTGLDRSWTGTEEERHRLLNS
jgi:hypothetical protein